MNKSQSTPVQSRSTFERQPDGTVKIMITVPWASVAKARETVLEETAKSANVAGFRQGKAPKKLVEESVNPERVQENLLRKILPDAYIDAVKQHGLTPIMNPKIHLEKLPENEDWVFHALTCEMPEVTLNNYKDAVQKVTAKSKIITPGKEPVGKAQDKSEKPNFDEIVKVMLDTVTTTIPKILIDQEVDRLLAQLLDDMKRLGMTLDQYLASTNRNPETLREEYAKRAENDIKLEFVLQKIAETEKISVEQNEVEEAIQKAKGPNERAHLESNRYLLANILRQQKTLDFLRNL